MITLSQFKRLSSHEQHIYLWERCTYLMTLNENSHLGWNLFEADGFFIEVQFDISQQRIVDLRAFTGTQPLEPYLEKIRVDSLW